MRTQKTLFTFAVVLVVSAFLGMYGHAVADDHGAEEVCQICVLLQTGAQLGIVFSLVLFLISHAMRVLVFPLRVVCLPVATPGRSPPIV
ncbi:MAG: hypothetical protein HOE48_08010 [Candidatus Latescibacteria bacterium]|nr:hypothetical protein [Candidatus Latescibacterota bacterium]MBT4137843.1 hypothetical protein [Candidatus Latescibacterota bacterium]